MKLTRALLSLSNKSNIEPFATALSELGVEIVSTGGTKKVLTDAGLKVTGISDVTGFPEILDGRVKTLHPRIHGALLARYELESHRNELAEHEIQPIGLVAVNLYPFRETIAREDHTLEDAIENIDIGGPTMIRAAAKNYRHVTVVVDPADYDRVIAELKEHGEVSEALRFELASKAFDHVADYDDAISNYLSSVSPGSTERREWPNTRNMQWRLKQTLRYGENPHQSAAFYAPVAYSEGLSAFEQLHGKEMSYNNFLDTDGAVRLVSEFDETACAIIKHSNPAGCALGDTIADAFSRALICDPVSAFGGIVALNRPVTADAAKLILDAFYEVVVAPDFEPDALEALKTKKNLRLLKMEGLIPRQPRGFDARRVGGGLLVQSWDIGGGEAADAKSVTEREPTDDERKQLVFAWKVCKHVKSNAIVFVKDSGTVGVGAGQMSRVDAARLAVEKAAAQKLDLTGSVAASDAFFPFRDGLDVIAQAGATAVIQPGGSVRDEEVIAAANEHKLAMVFTGMRHFRH